MQNLGEKKSYSCITKRKVWNRLKISCYGTMSRELNGSFITIWGVFSHDGLCDLLKLSGRMSSKKYQAMLHNRCILLGHQLGGAEWMFQEENDSCHTCEYVKKLFIKEILLFCHGPVKVQTSTLWKIFQILQIALS